MYTKNFLTKFTQSNSYGKTYGEHREALEFDKSQFIELIEFLKNINIDLFATPFDFSSVDFLESLNMPYYKIASADLTNIPLQVRIAKTLKPIFLSTGGGTLEDVERAVNNILKINKNLTVLHCTAAYPAPIEDMNLAVLKKYKEKFKGLRLGLSDHENGIDAGVIAYMLGATVFEKHFTLNRANKGTDHAFSLEPEGLKKFIRKSNRVDGMIGSNEKTLIGSKNLYLNEKSIIK